jgi:hypothetical protein
MQSQNHLVSTTVPSTNYSNLQGIQTHIGNMQMIQSNIYELFKNFLIYNVHNFAPDSFHINTTMEPIMSMQPMYIQPSHLYQQQHPDLHK